MNNILERMLVFVSGTGIGIITLMPNIMMSDSGSKQGGLAAVIGLSASASFAASGITGLLHNKYLPPVIATGLFCLGGILQVSAFVVPQIVYRN